MLNIIFGLIIFFLTNIIFSIPFSMIILSLFFGIPMTKELKQQYILEQNAPIKQFIINSIFLTILSMIIITILFIFLKNYIGFIIFGLIIAFTRALSSLGKSNYNNNLQDLLENQKNYIKWENLI